MFLFTTPTSSPAPSPASTGTPVVDAIRRGADATGTDFGYLLRTAKRESALDPAAKAPTSSASGLFQFVEQTWLGLVKSDGAKAGVGEAAQAVTARSDGTFGVSDPAARQAILKLREDPQVASVMAGALTRQNRDTLSAATGRAPSQGELYIAHVLGARGAAGLIETAGRDPDRAAALDFPEAARANRPIFFDRAGRARSSQEVYGVLAGDGGAAPATTPSATSPTRDTTAPTAAATLTGLQGLFQTGARSGPLSDAVARIWQVQRAGATGGASRAASYFPRSETVEVASAGEVEPTAAPGALASDAPAEGVRADVPLPPIRPRFSPLPSATGRARSTAASPSRP